MNCQKCRAPLRLDRSLQDLNPAALDLLTSPAAHRSDQDFTASRLPYGPDRKAFYDANAPDAGAPIYKRTIPAPVHGQHAGRSGIRDNPDMSFVMLTESQVVPAQQVDNLRHGTEQEAVHDGQESQLPTSDVALSRQVESSKQLFEVLSSRSDIDHPICTECTELLLSSLESRLTTSTKERDAFIAYLKSLNHNEPTAAEVSKAEATLASTKASESKAFADLLTLEKEKARLDDEIAKLEAESLALDENERDFWRSRNAFDLELSKQQNEHDALSAAYAHDLEQLERLQRTNVYNDSFSIGHDGYFGTINGLRLGRLPPPQNVDWSEINAAWGTAALLLATVADKLGFTFRGYQIKPMGSTSTIGRLDYPSPQHSTTSNPRSRDTQSGQQPQPKITPLDLFSSGDLPFSRMIIHRRLDAGMVAFLECLRQLGEFVKNDTDDEARSDARSNVNRLDNQHSKNARAPLRLPYEIHKDKIGDVSIKLSVSTDETWTRACKYTLTCCKYLLAHASNVAVPATRNNEIIGN